MSTMVLKQEVLDKIKGDAVLFGLVAKAAGVSAYTLPTLIKKNHYKLTQASVLNTIRKYSTEFKSDAQLLTEKEEATA